MYIVTRIVFGINSLKSGPWPLLNFKILCRNLIFAIESHLSLAKWPSKFNKINTAGYQPLCLSSDCNKTINCGFGLRSCTCTSYLLRN